MIRTLYLPKEHFVYSFMHHGLYFKAYDEIGRSLKKLREVIALKYEAARHDKRRHVYYTALIPNLERQFATMVSEGVLDGSVIIVEAASMYSNERKVA